MNTLKGVFPEPRPLPKRNFIKENMMHIKRMQGSAEDIKLAKGNKSQYRPNSPSKIIKAMKYIRETKKEIENYRKSASVVPGKSRAKPHEKTEKKRMENIVKQVPENKKDNTLIKQILDSKNLRESAIQTEDFSDLEQLYSTGTIKFPSGYLILEAERKAEKDRTNHEQRANTGDGDMSRNRRQEDYMRKPGERKDYIRENIEVLKNSPVKHDTPKNPCVAPPNYQKGVVPKYIKDRKESTQQPTKEQLDSVPEGHVILPDSERKETLKMLRQSYCDLITELNRMPVRSDTLKLQNRKIYIEKELKKLDEGIKIFSRPKVFVKIDS